MADLPESMAASGLHRLLFRRAIADERDITPSCCTKRSCWKVIRSGRLIGPKRQDSRASATQCDPVDCGDRTRLAGVISVGSNGNTPARSNE